MKRAMTKTHSTLAVDRRFAPRTMLKNYGCTFDRLADLTDHPDQLGEELALSQRLETSSSQKSPLWHSQSACEALNT